MVIDNMPLAYILLTILFITFCFIVRSFLKFLSYIDLHDLADLRSDKHSRRLLRQKIDWAHKLINHRYKNIAKHILYTPHLYVCQCGCQDTYEVIEFLFPDVLNMSEQEKAEVRQIKKIDKEVKCIEFWEDIFLH